MDPFGGDSDKIKYIIAALYQEEDDDNEEAISDLQISISSNNEE